MNEADPKKLNEKIKLAKQAVQDESEPWKTEAFKIILAKLIDSTIPSHQNISIRDVKTSEDSDSIEHKKEELAKKCAITKSELENVVSIHNNSIEIIHPIQDSDAQKHIIGAQIALIVAESVLNEEWLSSSKLTECFRAMGVKDLSNVSLNLKRYPDLIRSRGTRGHKEYKLTSNMGRQSAYELIRKLAKGERLNEN